MNELMVHVERCVRPVLAPAERKDRMREELLAHLTRLVEEERARTGDGEAAIKRAFERFGDPATLTGELQASVTRIERIDRIVQGWFAWRAPESASRYAWRMTARMLVFDLCVAGAMLLPLFFKNSALAADYLQRWWNGTSFLLIQAAVMAPLILVYFRFRDSCLGRLGVTRSLSRALGFAVLFAIIPFVAGIAWALVAFRDPRVSLALFPHWFSALLAAPLLLCIATFVVGKAQLRHTEWECLDITESAG